VDIQDHGSTHRLSIQESCLVLVLLSLYNCNCKASKQASKQSKFQFHKRFKPNVHMWAPHWWMKLLSSSTFTTEFPKFPKFPKALGGGEVGVQEMNEQTSDTLEVGNSIIHNVIETRDVGLQSIRLPMTLHIQPKYCIPGLCQPDTRPCRIKIHNLLSTSWGRNELESPVIKH